TVLFRRSHARRNATFSRVVLSPGQADTASRICMKTAIVNLGVILTGDWREPVAAGDSIVMDEGRIVHVGTAAASQIANCDVVIDADGATAIPGLIDSHVHVTFGDYTPRQRTAGFLE